MRAHRIGVLTTGLLVAGMLTACEAAEKVTGPDPADTAGVLAEELTAGEFADTGFTGVLPAEATKTYGSTIEGMGDVSPTVAVADVQEGDGTATATLAWTWPLGEQEWSYQSEADLELVDDEWLVTWDPAIVEPSLRRGSTLDLDTIPADRARLLGAGGLALVAERPVVRLGIDRTQVSARRAGASASRLADLVDVDRRPYVDQVTAAGDQAFVEAIVFRRDEVPPEVAQGYPRIPGALAVPDTLPLAPTREFAAPILGSVGEVTAEMIEDNPDVYSVGDQAGLSGLQARYDEQLRGTPGLVVDAVASDGKERELFREEPVAGRPLRLTLDHDLQLTAERLLADVGPASAIVAIRPRTGDILTAANGPGTNGYNMATFGQFAPGSTFKSVSTLGLLRAGLTPGTEVPCPPTIDVDGKDFKNYDDYPSSALGRIPLRTALANSCNTAFISQAGKVPDDGLVDAAASLGMGVDHDLGFPAYFGNVEPPASATEEAANLIGQGRVLASPMVMATVAASVQSGETVLPRLIKDHEVQQADVPELEAEEVGALREMLRGVVTSGSGSLLADVPGARVIAKTGTAEFERDGRVQTHAWMIGARQDLAVAVFVEVGDSGSSTAGPILEAFLRQAR